MNSVAIYLFIYECVLVGYCTPMFLILCIYLLSTCACFFLFVYTYAFSINENLYKYF